jgi:uncharacterized sodium:solute symporter family permease YidK
MRNVYRVLAFVLAAEVVIQGMAIAYALAGLGKWIEDDGGVLNKQVLDSDSPDFTGVGGFATHGINGMMLIPLIALLLLIVSFFAKVPGGVKRAGILIGLIILQVALGIFLHEVPYVAVLHVLNAFAIFVYAFNTGRAASLAPATSEPVPATV